MIPAITSNPNFQKLIISTGNILNVNNQLGRQSNEELIEGIKLTLDEKNDTGTNIVELNEIDGEVLRATQELNQKITENERSEINIGAKLFVNKNHSANVEEAIDALLKILKVEYVDNVVLSHHSNDKKDSGIDTNDEIRNLWSSLEKDALKKKIHHLGVADLEIESLTKLHEAAKVAPTILQVNLSSCCVVPPVLQEFCNKNDIQLLTHSDPEVLLNDEEFKQIIPNYTINWILRYQVHVCCRGVLTAKGYIVGATKK